MDSDHSLKKVFAITDVTGWLFFQSIIGEWKGYVTIKEPTSLEAVLAALVKKYTEHFASLLGVTDPSFFLVYIRGKIVDNSIVILPKESFALFPEANPGMITWPGAETRVLQYNDFLRLGKPLMGETPLAEAAYLNDSSFQDSLLGLSHEKKYGKFLEDDDINYAVKRFLITTKESSLSIINEAGVVTAIYLLMDYTLRSEHKIVHLPHVKVVQEYPFEYTLPWKVFSCKADLVIWDAAHSAILVVSEAKHIAYQNINNAIRQNVEQMRICSMQLKALKVYGIASTYTDWVLLQYERNAAREERVKLSQKISIGSFGEENIGRVFLLMKLIRTLICLALENSGLGFS